MSIQAAKKYGFPVIYRAVVTSITGTENIIIKASPLPTVNFYFVYQVKTSVGAERAGTSAVYDKTTGIVTVTGVTATDVVVIEGSWATV